MPHIELPQAEFKVRIINTFWSTYIHDACCCGGSILMPAASASASRGNKLQPDPNLESKRGQLLQEEMTIMET